MGKLIFSNKIERDMVEMLKHQDERVISLIYSQYSHILFNIILRIVKHEDLAQDIFQESLVKIWKKGALYDSNKGSLFTWVVSVCRNAAIDATRSKSYKLRERQVQEDQMLQVPVQEAPQGLMGEKLGEVLHLLTEDQKMLIDLSFFQGYTHEEIAKKLEIPLGTVKTRIRAAIKKLRKLLHT
ncbi:MAG: sigma-70 family RNA polymerase sigma factor [Bacteroidota bacterium]